MIDTTQEQELQALQYYCRGVGVQGIASLMTLAELDSSYLTIRNVTLHPTSESSAETRSQTFTAAEPREQIRFHGLRAKPQQAGVLKQ